MTTPAGFVAADRLTQGRWFTRNPLRVKLVGAVLALVALALVVIGISSFFFVRQYMLERTDNQLRSTVNTAQGAATRLPPGDNVVILQPDTVAGYLDRFGNWAVAVDATAFQISDLPASVANQATAAARLNQPFTASGSNGRFRWRVLAVANGPAPLVVAHELSNVDSTLDRLVFVEVLTGVSVLISLALVGAWMVRASLRPLAAIERTAAAIAGGDLTQRVAQLDPRTELGQLSAALNTMLTQIESAFHARAGSEARALRSEERMRQFVADASHELRTPLTTIRGFAELYRQGAAPDAGDVLRRIEGEAARMGLLVEDLLLLARLDEERPIQFSAVDLTGLVHDAAEAARAIAPERTIEVDAAGVEHGLTVSGDEGRLRQVIGNLVTNALTHTPGGTPIALRVRRDGNEAVVEVSDRGPGLTAEQAQHIFERFYRVDRARTRSSAAARGSTHSGSGLGLAIVAALVSAHAGSVEVDTKPGEGATFRVRLPLGVR